MWSRTGINLLDNPGYIVMLVAVAAIVIYVIYLFVGKYRYTSSSYMIQTFTLFVLAGIAFTGLIIGVNMKSDNDRASLVKYAADTYGITLTVDEANQMLSGKYTGAPDYFLADKGDGNYVILKLTEIDSEK